MAVFLGLMLWVMPLGDAWINASFDYQLRFGSRHVTNKVALVLMDNAAYDQFDQSRDQPWSRRLHAQLLNRLADDRCAMVVIDSLFRKPRNAEDDAALADALRRQQRAVLMADQSEITHPSLTGVQPALPFKDLLEAAHNNWGVARLDPDLDRIVRKHWPFPSPGPYASLPWAAAVACGAKPDPAPKELWLRYYGQNGPGVRMSYGFALTQPPGYFRDYIVFIGNDPKTTVFDNEPDEFGSPYTRWTAESSGGVDILCTMFLNLLRDEALERPAKWVEFLVLCVSGAALGGGLSRRKWRTTLWVAVGCFVFIPLAAALLSHFSNYWFPWFIVSGAQLPVAVVWAIASKPRVKQEVSALAANEVMPETPGYELIQPPFGSGAYGKVWLARSRDGKWRALKAIYLSHFQNHSEPYDREYQGIEKYMQLSRQHDGLLQVEFVSPKGKEYFYYVMELGDSVTPDWEATPSLYKPRDLDRELDRFPGRRMPADECVRLGIGLCNALGFIHNLGLTHRDINPQNIIFVQGQPKLADLGLITYIRTAGQAGTLVGTPGYIPPPPDRPGTVSADIYALGIVLYVVSTGKSAAQFPEMPTAVVNLDNSAEYLPFNNIILTACEPLPQHRYASAEMMRAALEKLQG